MSAPLIALDHARAQADVLRALERGDVHHALELARQAGFLPRGASGPVAVESVWLVLREPRSRRLLPATVRAEIARSIRVHVARFGTRDCLGAEDEGSLAWNLDAVRNLRRGRPWRRMRRLAEIPERTTTSLETELVLALDAIAAERGDLEALIATLGELPKRRSGRALRGSRKKVASKSASLRLLHVRG